MKKFYIGALLLTFLSFGGYAQNGKQPGKTGKSFAPNPINQDYQNRTGYIHCLTDENEERLQELNPERANRQEFETWLAPKISSVKQKLNANAAKTMGNVVTIPVVVHVIHDGDAEGVSENISYDRVLSQITVLNEDYRRMLDTPGYNDNPVGADVEIEFCLAQTAPDGSLTDGVDRVNLSGYTWNGNNVEGVLKPQTQWDPTQYFNIWVCQFGGNLGGVLGYAQFPDTSGLGGLSTTGGYADTDGVVVDWRCFGSTDYVTGTFFNGYDKGRTLTHEIGHCFGLLHIWGDSSSCIVNASDSFKDYCPDTPAASQANSGCTLPVDSCPLADGNDMVENYMDYTNDTCMNIFTEDQKARILAVLANSPRRMELVNSTVCNAPTPEDNDGRLQINSINMASCSSDLAPTITLKNLGNLNLTEAIISYNIDNGTSGTYTWTGNLAYGEQAEITFPTLTVTDSGEHTFNATITSVNQTTDQVSSNNSSSTVFSADASFASGTVISLELQPDYYGTEISWTLKDASGTTLYSGDNYSDGTYTGNPLIGYTFTLPALVNETFTLANGCYTFNIVDDYGDGICSLAAQGLPEADGYYSLLADGVAFVTGCDYTDEESVSFKINNLLSTKGFALEGISLYPNPASNVLNINTGNAALPEHYTIYNTLGQTIMDKNITSANDLQINTSSIATGIYVIKIAKGEESVSLRFVKK